MIRRHDHHRVDVDAIVRLNQFRGVVRAAADTREDAGVRRERLDARLGDVDALARRQRVVLADVRGRQKRPYSLVVQLPCVFRDFLVFDLEVVVKWCQKTDSNATETAPHLLDWQ
ncbi:hypothetical protein C477_16905 [Haloterrigena salina JCM 13891]|uniref:Uncharacterized protein n=1 Tax=Haloterrigena salina JCM 13891 TaxID=1227488 RepID=M0BWI6_9EURY|nr:hypothetical protein C477_16905 [Haloterrigena salina JCM 13891]